MVFLVFKHSQESRLLRIVISRRTLVSEVVVYFFNITLLRNEIVLLFYIETDRRRHGIKWFNGVRARRKHAASIGGIVLESSEQVSGSF